jgi:hypothetical protein
VTPILGGAFLQFVATPIASQLTGLSTEKLREWTSRRALVPADVRPKQKGSPAKFSWQTILVLRIADCLRSQFKLELEAHKPFFADFRRKLRKTSFIALWGNRLALAATGEWKLIGNSDPVPPGDVLLIHLDPHLAILRDGFALPDPALAEGQFDLFSLPNLHRPKAGSQVSRETRSPHRRSA